MSTKQVAIILKESEGNILNLASKMHVWLAGTKTNIKIFESLSVTSLPEELLLSTYEINDNSNTEEQCLLGLDLVESHHSAVFGAESWLEIQVHGCAKTQRLEKEFLDFGNTKITKQNYGFKVTRSNEM